MPVSRLVFRFVTLSGLIALASTSICQAVSPVVPGTGVKIANVGDDFEDANWRFMPNFPKSSDEQDEQQRQPAGWSTNRRWYEGIKRGCPDVVQRVPTPKGGLEGSTGSLLLRTVHSGIPGRQSYTMQQDDFICNVWQRIGQKIPVQHTPNCVVRVFMPPIDQWENRTGATFGYRLSLETHAFVVPQHKKKKEKTSGVENPKRNGRWNPIGQVCSSNFAARPTATSRTTRPTGEFAATSWATKFEVLRSTSPAGGPWVCPSPPTAGCITILAKASTT